MCVCVCVCMCGCGWVGEWVFVHIFDIFELVWVKYINTHTHTYSHIVLTHIYPYK